MKAEPKKQQEPMHLWRYTYTQARLRMWAIILLASLLIILQLLIGWTENLWGIVGPFISLLTLGVAILVWYQQVREEWEEDYLPKRFTAHFSYQGKEVMRCENAHLTAEGDIRALAQQIGSQMVDPDSQGRPTQLLFVAPEVKVAGPIVNKREKYVHYTVRLNLTKLPSPLELNTIRIWRESFMNSEYQPNFETVNMEN